MSDVQKRNSQSREPVVGSYPHWSNARTDGGMLVYAATEIDELQVALYGAMMANPDMPTRAADVAGY